MSEPFAKTGAGVEIAPGLVHFAIHDERIDFSSDAFAIAGPRGVVLVDPLPFEPGAPSPPGPIRAIVLTAASHQRAAWRLRREAAAPVHVPAGSTGLDERPDVEYRDGDLLPGGLRAVHAPGPRAAHHALHLAGGSGVLLVGDLLLRRADGAVGFLPRPHMEDPALARESARRLLGLRFDLLGFAHGAPVATGGRRLLEALIAADAGQAG